jgi:predicted enzyme involved in methoxymalonyl-ACP biosynthesis
MKGSLFSVFYKNKTGNYGEVITLLTDKKKNAISFVMSCRIFQRKIELEFLRLLITNGFKINKFTFKKTKKNELLRIFYKDFFSSHIDPYGQKFNNENFVKNLSFEKKIFKSQIQI